MPYVGTKPLLAKPRQLFNFIFQRHPRPINCANVVPTADLAQDWSRHPYHIRTVRRLQQFDPTKLHWRVTVSMDLSKSGYVRDKAAKRVRQAITDELRANGYAPDGRRMPRHQGSDTSPPSDLQGAMLLVMVKEPYAITASIEEVRARAKWAVRKVLQAQSDEHQPQESSRHARGDKDQRFQHRGSQYQPSQPRRQSRETRGADDSPNQHWRAQSGEIEPNRPTREAQYGGDDPFQ